MRIRLAVLVTLLACVLVVSAEPAAQRARAGELVGSVPSAGGFGVVSWSGGTTAELATAAQQKGCSALSAWVTQSGQFVGYIYGAPAFVNARFAAQLPGLAIAPGAVVLVCQGAPITLAGSGRAFVDTFDGAPPAPQAFRSPNWDVVVHSRDRDTWDSLERMHVGHGTGCEPPPASSPQHGDYALAVFRCRDHVMTAMLAAGYGVMYLTPNVMADWSGGGTVSISWDVSTRQSSGAGRDWWDVWVTPFEDNLIHPLEEGLPDLQGPPRHAFNFRMRGDNGSVKLCTTLYRDFADVFSSCSGKGWDTVLTPSPTVRSKFEVLLSRDRLKVWMPQYNLVWYDGPIPALSWTQGVVQFGHHAYNPEKADSIYCRQLGGAPCRANTWHWDNASISSAVPFSMLAADRRYADKDTGSTVSFSTPAPAGSFLRFSGVATVEVSLDGGRSWQRAQQQAQSMDDEGHFASYWMPIPAGTSSVQFRGKAFGGTNWRAKDISIWAR